jgi:DNA-binding NarL/FixJ family response regulator
VHPEPAAIRVVIAEDGVLLREGLAGLLERFGFQTVAAVGDARALQTAVAEHIPDLVITDIRMPPGYADEGLRAAVELRHARPGLAVVVLSQYVQHSYAADLLDSGDGRSVGYLLKDRVADVEEFIAALRRVAAGGTVVDPLVISQLVRRRRDPLSSLSARTRGPGPHRRRTLQRRDRPPARRLRGSRRQARRQHPRQAPPPAGRRHQPPSPRCPCLPQKRRHGPAVICASAADVRESSP